jgi:hypothetical protein
VIEIMKLRIKSLKELIESYKGSGPHLTLLRGKLDAYEEMLDTTEALQEKLFSKIGQPDQ